MKGSRTNYYSGFDPRTLDGCVLWLDATDPASFVFSSGSNVSQWKDKSSNAFTGTSGGSPVRTLVDGVPAVTFNGSQYFDFGNVNNLGTNQMNIFVVSKFNTTGDGTLVGKTLLGGASYRYALVRSGGVLIPLFQGFDAGTANNSGVADANTTRRLLSMNWDRTTLSILQNGSSTFSLAFATTSNFVTTFNLLVGAYNNGSGGVPPANGLYLNGSINEMLFFFTTLTTAQRQQIEGYLSRKWGLQSSIPATHPYKSIPPTLRPFSPVDIGGCALWLDAADARTLTLTGSNVTAWADKGISNVSLTLSNGVGGSTIATTYSNRPVVQFSNSAFYNSTFSFPLASRSIFVVTAEVVHANYRGILNFASNGQSDYNTVNGYTITSTNTVGSNVEFAQNFGNGGFIYRYNAGDGSLLVPFQVYGDVTSNTSVNLYITGSNAYSTTTSVTPQTSTGLTIAGRGLSPNTGTLAMAEIVLYNVSLTTAQRQQVEGYLAKKWGLQSSMVVGHPYRFGLPALTVGFTPVAISGCSLWLDAADRTTLTLSGSNVTQWRDKSGNAYNATGFGGTALTSFGSGLSGITLNGSDTYFYASNATAMNTTSNLSAFVVATFGNMTNDWRRLLSFGDPDYNAIANAVAFERYSTANQITLERTGFGTPLNTYNVPFQFVGSVVFNSSGGNQYVNGILNSTGTSAGAFNYSLYNVGRYSGGGFVWTGVVCEVIAYNASLTTAQRQQVEGYLASKWGLRSSLPNNHPYRLTKP